MDNLNFKEIKYDKFHDFYVDIQPFGKYGILQENYIFRGVSDSDYDLLPSALRKDREEKIKIFTKVRDDSNQPIGLYMEEVSAIFEFYKKANFNGLPIISIKEFSIIKDILPIIISNKSEQNKNGFISNELYEIFALAQHYGVPTRLLDWTKDINIALYFAIRNAVKKIFCNHDKLENIIIPDKMFSIWMLNFRYFSIVNNINIKLLFIEPAYINNKYLSAQKGLFSYEASSVTKEDIKRGVETLSTKIKNLNIANNFTHTPLLYKFCIPYSEAIEGFFTLRKIGYSYSRVFPDLNNVVEDLKEERLWGYINN